MTEEKQLIPFKSVNLSLIEKRIDKALQKTNKHFSTELTGEAFEGFVHDLCSAFPMTKIRYDVVFASVMDLVSKTLTRDVIHATAWRLAGNMEQLKKGRPVPPFTRQTELEWCPVTIVRGNIGRGYKGRLGHHFDYRVMAGQAAGCRFTTFWSFKYTKFVARSVGFRKIRKGYLRLTDGIEMVKMQLYLLFDPKLTKDEQAVAYHFYVPASVRAKNQQILQQRVRIIPCPLEYKLTEQPCHTCPKGYDECLAGCHPLTYKEKPCPRCMSPRAWFDPLDRGIICVDCEEHDRRHKSAEKN